MNSLAVVMERPEHLVLRQLDLLPPGSDDVVVDIAFSGISTARSDSCGAGGCLRFPAWDTRWCRATNQSAGSFRPERLRDGASVTWCSCPVRAVSAMPEACSVVRASRLVASGSKVIPIVEGLGASGVLLALAATAQHALAVSRQGLPELIVGHGVLAAC